MARILKSFKTGNANNFEMEKHLVSMLFKAVNCYNYGVHENLIGGSSIIWVLPLVIADSERDMPEIKP
jgi:hypothetical protein